MNTKNIKTAIIILLVFANIFFIYNIKKLRLSSENIPAEMIDNAVNVLERSGLLADRAKIYEKRPSKIIYEGVYSENLQKSIIEAFSGEDFEKSVERYVPAGISYAAGDYRFIFFDEDHFKVIITEKDYADTEKIEEIEEKNAELPEIAAVGSSDGDIKKAARIIGEFLKKYQNGSAQLGLLVTEYQKDAAGRQRARIVQTVDNTPIDSHSVYAEIENGQVKYFSGRWYFGELSVIARKMELLDSVNILFKSVETDINLISGKRLESMDTEYNVVPHSEENFWLVPSWRLVFEGGIKLLYNMVTGNKIITENITF